MTHENHRKKNGKPVSVIVPYKERQRLQEQLEDALDVIAYDNAKADYERSGRRGYPAEVVDRMINGEHPVKVLREWQKLTQAQLSAKTGLAKAVISHIETGVRSLVADWSRGFYRAIPELEAFAE